MQVQTQVHNDNFARCRNGKHKWTKINGGVKWCRICGSISRMTYKIDSNSVEPYFYTDTPALFRRNIYDHLGET